jgi:uncharacterized protein
MEKIFISVFNYFDRRRPLLFFSFAALILLFAALAAQLHLEEDISKIIPKDKKIEKLNEVFQNSKFADKLVFTLSMADQSAAPDSLVAFAGAFTDSLEHSLHPFIKKINSRVDDAFTLDIFHVIREHLPVYLTQTDYQSIDSLIQPEQLQKSLEQDIRTISTPAGLVLKNIILEDPAGISFLGLRKLQQLQYDENFELYDGYILTRDQKHLLLLVTPTYPADNTGKNIQLFRGLDLLIQRLCANQFANISVSYFGAAAVAAGNASQLRKDTINTQVITVIFLIVFIGWYFRKKRAPFIILIPVLFGALFSLAMIQLIKGGISVIALATGSVVLGIAVNYSLHVFNHYRHVRSARQVVKDLSFPLTIGSFTTIGGFFCLEFVKSEMLKDLGLFAGFSLIGAALCSLILLPQLMRSKQEEQKTKGPGPSRLDKLLSIRPAYNKYLVLVIILATGFFFYTSQWVGFQSDLTDMNFMTDQLKQSEKRLDSINQFSLKSVYLVTEGKTLNEALSNNEKLVVQIEQLKAKNIVKKYSGVSSMLLSDSLQALRLAHWNQYWTPEKKQQVLASLIKAGAGLGFKTGAFEPFRNFLNKDYQPVSPSQMVEIRKNFLDDYITEKPGHSTVVTLVKVSAVDKQALYDRFENSQLTTVVDKQYLTNKLVEIVNSDFTRIALLTGILVFSVMLLTYGRIELTLVSFIPMFISFIWILGIMGLVGIQFNIINIILSALIFGLGDDYSLFIMDGLLQEYKTGKKNLSSYKSSIMLSAITTVAGLGVLIFARHPALRSIAIISIIGMCCVVVISQFLIPFLFSLLIQNRIRKKQFPWTISGWLISIFAFSYFFLGSLILTFLGFLFVKINPFNKEKGKLIYHTLISAFTWSMMYIMLNVKKRVLNPGKEDFSKPAIIICNHQSFLDILVTTMLHPKLILFTNHWVWNSPVFGAVVRMADYYPILARGVENSLDLLKDRVRNGYSIVVFPEGTRSRDGLIKRFHKGAFYLADQLNLDILPILIHGTGYTMTKADFLLKNGTVTLKLLGRIRPDDRRFGDRYGEKAKNIGRYFREEFRQFKSSVEVPSLFKEQLIYNYLYKGPIIEWYLKVKLRLEKNYQQFHDLLPRQGKFLDMGCGYGFMAYMLHFASAGRDMTGVDYDEEKIEVANHCFSKNEQIRFIAADVMEFRFEKYDGIVMADMLHYLKPEQQKQLIEESMRSLNPGGKLIIREGNKELESRHQGTKLTEFFSTSLFGFNKTSPGGLFFLSGNMVRQLAADEGMNCREIDNAKFTSNVIFVIERKQ